MKFREIALSEGGSEMWNDVLLERLTTLLGKIQSRTTSGDRLAVVAPVLDAGEVEELRQKSQDLSAERTRGLRDAQAEFNNDVRPTQEELDAIMRERKKLLDEQRKAAERADAEQRKAIYEEYKCAVAPAADARDVALAKAQRRWERKARKINEEYTRKLARMCALAVLGMREEGEA